MIPRNALLSEGGRKQTWRRNRKRPASAGAPSAFTLIELHAMWVDAWPLEADRPWPDLYNGTRVVTGMARCTLPRHGGSAPRAAPRAFDISQKLPGAINIGMADGHVELARLENLWQYYWHRNWIPPTTRPR